MKKRIFWGSFTFLCLGLAFVFGIEQSRYFVFDMIAKTYTFLMYHATAILTAFFLVNGKFIFLLFFKKILILSATGLGKRYLIEKVFNHNLKIHFLDYISRDIKNLMIYIKSNFQNFPIVKQIIAGFIFLGSLSFVGKFMGGMLAMKVFIAKFWSFILALVLKFSTAIIYFFTDYLWGSWIAPIIEVVIFSWFVEWLEKVPFLKKFFHKIYRFFLKFFLWIDAILEKVFHVPMKRFFKFLAKYIQRHIYKFIGFKRVSCYQRLLQMRGLKLNAYKKLKEKRKNYQEKVLNYENAQKRLKKKRLTHSKYFEKTTP
jgi:hypothetical protein